MTSMLLLALCVVSLASAADLVLDVPTLSKGSPNIAAMGRRNEKGWTSMTGIVGMRFTVPPSKGLEFKEAWLKLKAAVEENEGEQSVVFDLYKSSLDNWVWYHYGMWESLDFMYNNHFEALWYAEFAAAVDSLGANWEAQWLGEDSFKEKGGEMQRGWVEGASKNGMFSVVVTWEVPPGVKAGFLEAWNKAADATFKEEGAMLVSLQKDWMKSDKYYAYAEWESVDAFMDHLRSAHHEDLQQWAAENDAHSMIEPVVKVGNQKE